VWCDSTGATISNCVLIGNSASAGGGVYGGTLRNCVLTRNSALNEGAGASAATLYNCTLTSNSAYYGGGTSGSTLYNCTLISNSASWYGGGVVWGTLYNCIVYDNTAGSEPNYHSSILNYCCAVPLADWGVGNIADAPLFVQGAEGDFRLRSSSPCINAGNNAYVSEATDLNGKTRIVSGTVDIGAYEYQGSGSAISYAWLQSYGLPTDGSADYVDTDGDGLNNYQEWLSGTNPTNALSVLRLLSAMPTSTNVLISWQGVAGVNYFLERSTNLGPSIMRGGTNFVAVATNLIGQTGTNLCADTNATGPGPFYYRVGVSEP
jgi:hypothetical protein